MIDLEAIRARDADYNDIFEEQSHMSPDIAHRLVAWPVADRRALLAAYDALAAAARKVKCWRCYGREFTLYKPEAESPRLYERPCPDCADLRALLAALGEPNE